MPSGGLGLTVRRALPVALLAATMLPARGAAQLPHPIPTGDSALAACGRAASRGDKRAANTAADSAERIYRAVADSGLEHTATVRLARVIGECRIPVASFFSKPRLARQAEGMLTRLLASDSTSWEGRYTLALLYYHAPSFVGKTDDAIRQFETLLAQQGASAAFAEQAAPYAYLGDLYERTGRKAQAVSLWRRAITLFPGDTALKRRLVGAGSGG